MKPQRPAPPAHDKPLSTQPLPTQPLPPVGPAIDLQQLFQQLYGDLRRLAHSKLHHAGEISQLNTTGLVHDSYMRLSRMRGASFTDENDFMGYAAKVMRSIIVDAVRARNAQRRSGGADHTALDTELSDSVAAEHDDEALRVHEALAELELLDGGRLARVVELRYFVGLSDDEIAAMLGLTRRTVQRDWLKARLMLKTSLRAA